MVVWPAASFGSNWTSKTSDTSLLCSVAAGAVSSSTETTRNTFQLLQLSMSQSDADNELTWSETGPWSCTHESRWPKKKHFAGGFTPDVKLQIQTSLVNLRSTQRCSRGTLLALNYSTPIPQGL